MGMRLQQCQFKAYSWQAVLEKTSITGSDDHSVAINFVPISESGWTWTRQLFLERSRRICGC